MASPVYSAVIELEPAGSVVVENVALLLATVPLPRTTEPLRKLTVPVGAAPPDVAGVIVAVNVTFAPNAGEVGENVTAVVVGARATVTELAVEVLGAKLAFPWYWAVIELVPTGSVEVLSVADPAVSVSVASKVEPWKKSTEPVGVPPLGDPLTLAVSATDCP